MTMLENRRGLSVGACVLLAAATPMANGCGEQESANYYVGELEGTDALIGFAIEQDPGEEAEHVAAYICGGAQTLITHTRWFGGVSGPADSLEKDGWRIDIAEQSEALLRGSVVPPTGQGAAIAFELARATAELSAIYTLLDGDCRAGAIVIDGEDQNGETSAEPVFQGARCAVQNVSQVTPILPLALNAEGLEVEIDADGASRRVNVVPLLPDEL